MSVNILYVFFLIKRPTPRATRTDTLFPYPTLCRSLDRTEVRTPIDGVACKVPDVGGYVMPGLPVISVVDAKGPWVEANLKESQLERVRPGQKDRKSTRLNSSH